MFSAARKFGPRPVRASADRNLPMTRVRGSSLRLGDSGISGDPVWLTRTNASVPIHRFGAALRQRRALGSIPGSSMCTTISTSARLPATVARLASFSF